MATNVNDAIHVLEMIDGGGLAHAYNRNHKISEISPVKKIRADTQLITPLTAQPHLARPLNGTQKSTSPPSKATGDITTSSTHLSSQNDKSNY